MDPAPALDAQGEVPAAPYDNSPLQGTAPEYSAHVIVRPVRHSRPAATWPSHVDAACPLLAELSSRARPGGALAGFGVSFADADTDAAPAAEAWDPRRVKEMRTPPNQAAEDELFWLHVYAPKGVMARIPEPVSLRTLPGATELRAALDALLKDAEKERTRETHVFVCVHGMRDCRCGVAGSDVLTALRAQVSEHEDTCRSEGSMPARRVRVFPVSHVGGHKWAANALVYPHGDWYGNLRVSDAPLLLRAALAPPSSRHDLYDRRERLVLWPRWRGRLGQTKAEQREHMDLWGPPLVYSAQLKPRVRTAPGSAEAGADTGAPSPTGTRTPETATDKEPMAHMRGTAAEPTTVPLRFRSADGDWFHVEGRVGESLMEAARRHDLPGIEAACEGALECATCHAYLCDPADGAPDTARGAVDAPPGDAERAFGRAEPSEDEDDMLECTIDRRGSSRLTCQIPVSPALSAWMQRGGRDTGRWTRTAPSQPPTIMFRTALRTLTPTIRSRAFSTTPSAALSRVSLIGRLVAPPEVRESRNGKEYLRYVVATTDPLGPPNEDGSPPAPTSSFHSVFAFGDTTVNRLRDLQKGTLLFVEADFRVTRAPSDSDVPQDQWLVQHRSYNVLARPRNNSDQVE
ncbi:lipoyl synthase [Malassezia sp. CBS 17886]|nr:lipoyl synthase [Malassezia sp. CBS 17886]